MTDTLTLGESMEKDPKYRDYGLISYNDPRLYRIRVRKQEGTGFPHVPSRKIIDMANVIVDLHECKYVKNRYETDATPPYTLIQMFRAVEVTDVWM